MRTALRLNLLLTLFLLSGCWEKELLANLDSKQSIEALVVLRRAGISAERSGGGARAGGNYKLTVKEADYHRALEVLHEFGLPRSENESAENLTKAQGFIPASPELSALRADLAVTRELERALEIFPEIEDVRAVVRWHSARVSKPLLADESPTIAVVLRYRSSRSAGTPDVRKIQEFLKQFIPGIKAEAIKVALVESATPSSNGAMSAESFTQLSRLPLVDFRVAAEEVSRARQQIVLLLSGVCIIGILLGILLAYYRIRNSAKGKGGMDSGSWRESFFKAGRASSPVKKSDAVLSEQRDLRQDVTAGKR